MATTPRTLIGTPPYGDHPEMRTQRVVMATPSVEDDGRTVTVDLHGATVKEAVDLTYGTLRLAEERGRNRLTLIHGSSTTTGRQDRTIKSTLRNLVDQGDLGLHANSVLRSRDKLTLVLDLTASSDPTRIELRDVWPRV